MAHTYKHKAQGKLRILKKIYDPSSSEGKMNPWLKAFGYNIYNKESTQARQFTRKKFRAQSKQALIQVECDPDNTTFPLDPRTQGWETH